MAINNKQSLSKPNQSINQSINQSVSQLIDSVRNGLARELKCLSAHARSEDQRSSMRASQLYPVEEDVEWTPDQESEAYIEDILGNLSTQSINIRLFIYSSERCD